MTLYDLLNKAYETNKYTIHLTRRCIHNGLGFTRTDTITDVDSIEYSDQTRAEITMFAPKSNKHLEIWAFEEV